MWLWQLIPIHHGPYTVCTILSEVCTRNGPRAAKRMTKQCVKSVWAIYNIHTVLATLIRVIHYTVHYCTVYIQSRKSISSERLEELEECLTPSSQCFINKKKSCESSWRTPIKRKNLGRILLKPFLLFSFFSYHFYLSKKNRKNLFLCGQKFLAVEQKIPLWKTIPAKWVSMLITSIFT